MKESCPCKKVECKRHGKCEICRQWHKNNKKILPTCERMKLKEKRQNEK